ncbi:MAG: DMT family transporter [Verrucomicrobia bacterium]|nr:DMT family transporter [Verrucomicrobiota bacterium]
MQPTRHPVLLLLVAAGLWSTGGLLIKLVDWNILAIAGMRSAVAAVTMLLLLGRPRWTFSAPQVAGAVAYAGTVALFVAATRLTTAANAIFLQYTAPIYVAILGAWFLREYPSRLDYALMALALAGVGLFFMDQLSLAGWWGNVCALLSGFAFASLVVLLRKQKDATPVATVLLGNILTALVCLPFASLPLPGLTSWVGLLLLGVFQLGLSYVCYARAIQRVRALEATLIGTIEPILNPLWVMLILGEVPTAWALAGGTLVLAAAALRGVATARVSGAT